ncbi:hypothetical protein [Peribacillus sp. NPDC097895]|uniref:hypothetical protein n=1 Tax=Peribacillus sp. NPDC097895 TaxID=3390619 RepID=UPI003D062F24
MEPDHGELIRLMSAGPRGTITMIQMPYVRPSIANSTSNVSVSADGVTAFASGKIRPSERYFVPHTE